MRVLVVLNPRAGRGRGGVLAETLASAFARHGVTAELARPGTRDAAERAVADLDPAGVDAVVAAGGDGTIHAVVNGLMRHAAERRPALGVLPVGTGNAFARELGLAGGDWSAAVDLVAHGSARPVDVARVRDADGETFHFLNVLGAGFVMDAARAANRFRFLGPASYTAGALAAVARLRCRPFRVVLDDVEVAQDCLFVEVCNSRYTGTRFLMAPDASVEDGLLDVVRVRSVTRRRLLRLFPTIFEGSHTAAPEVTVERARRVRLEAAPGEPVLADGEVRGRLPLDIECLAGALRVIFPSEGPRGEARRRAAPVVPERRPDP